MFNLWHTIFHVRTKMSIVFHISIILLLKWSFNYVTGIRQKRREIIRCFSLVDGLVISQHFHIFEKKRFFSIVDNFSLIQEISKRKKISGESHQFSTTLISGWEIIQKCKIGGVCKSEGNLLDRFRISCRNFFVFSQFREIG